LGGLFAGEFVRIALKRHHGGQAMVTSPPDDGPSHRRDSARYQARLDAALSATLEDLARTVHRTRGMVLRGVMPWGLVQTKRWSMARSPVVAVPPVPVLVPPALLAQVQDAAASHGVTMAVWLRHALPQIAADDVPASRQAGETRPRSHDSGHHGRRLMLCLDDETSNKWERLTQAFGRSAAEVIRQLIAQAKSEDFLESWHLAVNERRTIVEVEKR